MRSPWFLALATCVWLNVGTFNLVTDLGLGSCYSLAAGTLKRSASGV